MTEGISWGGAGSGPAQHNLKSIRASLAAKDRVIMSLSDTLANEAAERSLLEDRIAELERTIVELEADLANLGQANNTDAAAD